MVNNSIDTLSSASPKVIKTLKQLGILTIKDLLYYFPNRYDDFSRIIPIKDLEVGDHVTIQGKILSVKNNHLPYRRLFITEAIIEDDSASVKAIWFNQPFLVRNLKPDQLVNLSGKVALWKDSIYISNPSYEVIRSFQKPFIHTSRLVPIYSETRGLTSRWLRHLIQPLLKFANELSDLIPISIQKHQNLLTLKQAIEQIHFPDNYEMAEKAKRRLAFEELFLLQLSEFLARREIQKEKSFIIPLDLPLIKSLIAELPFKLTNAQKKATWEILKDLEKEQPMNRLLEGDVGSGKTVVAALAALNAIKVGHQVALMAPTEILAFQHFKTISEVFKKFDVKIALLTAGKKIMPEGAEIFIGTHALIQKKVSFNNLALVIIDEQHRFGVKQRARLAKQKLLPHFLSMTATPIPRTLALAVYGDLDLSILYEMPKGRQKIITKIVTPTERKEVYNFIRQQVKKGRQAFVICPRIDSFSGPLLKDSSNKGETVTTPLSKFNRRLPLEDSLLRSGPRVSLWADAKAVEEEYKKLSKEIFPDLRIGKLHGRLKALEKESIMRKFKNREIDILVSTSIVEVGIDIPNATIMMIEGAERFGLAQLHQFRGRVGRGEQQSYCFLLTDSTNVQTNKRLKAILKAETGFGLAEKDLEIRGPGNLYGIKQSGLPDLAMASLADAVLIKQAHSEALNLLKYDPNLQKFPQLLDRVKQYKKEIHFE